MLLDEVCESLVLTLQLFSVKHAGEMQVKVFVDLTIHDGVGMADDVFAFRIYVYLQTNLILAEYVTLNLLQSRQNLVAQIFSALLFQFRVLYFLHNLKYW